MRDPLPADGAAKAARAALGLGPEDGPETLEAAFRRRARPLAQAAGDDPEASERLRALIEARTLLRRLFAAPPAARPPAAPRPSDPGPTEGLRPLGFRLLENGRDVEVTIALDALERAAEAGALGAVLIAPVLRRCPHCARSGRSVCGLCGGAGVVETGRRRAVPLDLARFAADDLEIEASPWSDAVGRGARGGPILRARLA